MVVSVRWRWGVIRRFRQCEVVGESWGGLLALELLFFEAIVLFLRIAREMAQIGMDEWRSEG
jgi:hypothetical protein